MSDYRFDDAVKDAGETLPVMLDCFPVCAMFWRGNERVSSAEYVRPSRATGFAYQAGAAGTTAGREPLWPKVLGGTVVDGSVTWTAVAASTNGIDPISAPTAVSDPTGLTINVSVSESCKLQATYAGGTEGQAYDAVYTFTLDSKTRIARQRVEVKKR